MYIKYFDFEWLPEDEKTITITHRRSSSSQNIEFLWANIAPKRANGVTSVMHGYYYRLPSKGTYRHWLILCQLIKPVQRQFEWETTAFGLQERALPPRKLNRTHEVQWCIVSWDLKFFFSEKLVFHSKDSLTYWASLVETRSWHSSWKRKCSFFYVYIRSTYKSLRLM